MGIPSDTMPAPYRGRFAPSPTGPLHLGSLVAALGSWLDARAHQGTWLVRIEDLDPPRERASAAQTQLKQLERYGMVSDEAPVFQSTRTSRYEAALKSLENRVYLCQCTRADTLLRVSEPGRTGIYDGYCRERHLTEPGAWRFRPEPGHTVFTDRRCGMVRQDVCQAVGDFIVRRRDGLWAYQLAVVVDDADQGITDVVRGADLLDNTPRQLQLQHALGLKPPRYLHVPLVLTAQGRKLSKHDQAPALGLQSAVQELDQAWQWLGFDRLGADTVSAFFQLALPLWQARYVQPAQEPACP